MATKMKNEKKEDTDKANRKQRKERKSINIFSKNRKMNISLVNRRIYLNTLAQFYVYKRGCMAQWICVRLSSPIALK